MDFSRAGEGVMTALIIFAVACVAMSPLAIWKLVDILRWLI